MEPEEALHLQDDELLDVLTKNGEKTGVSKSRGLVHRDGDYHRAVHVWIYSESTQELLLQRRSDCKDSWPGLWDISSAGHISAGDSSLLTARRELHEELGISLPKDAFELIFVFLQECVINDGKFINNEYNDVYLVTTLSQIPQEAFVLQPPVTLGFPPTFACCSRFCQHSAHPNGEYSGKMQSQPYKFHQPVACRGNRSFFRQIYFLGRV